MHETRFFDAAKAVTQTEISNAPLCIWWLACHVLLGLIIAYTGCKNSRWE
jgi:hypothetical protein